MTAESSAEPIALHSQSGFQPPFKSALIGERSEELTLTCRATLWYLYPKTPGAVLAGARWLPGLPCCHCAAGGIEGAEETAGQGGLLAHIWGLAVGGSGRQGGWLPQ